MTKEKKSTSKKTSKAKSVEVTPANEFDLIINFGPAEKAQAAKESEIESQILQHALKEAVKDINAPWYKKAWKRLKNLFNR